MEPGPSAAPCLEIAHVLFMDIVAYSTLPMDYQQRLLTELQETVRHTPEFARAQAEDQLIRLPTGDGMALVFFHDPEAPARCALELGRSLRRNPDIKVRIGIHSGPVYRVADINANRNVAGGGINIAQRVMDCADAGHILLSSTAADVLGQLSAWRPMLHDLGEVEVKHGVRVYLYNLYSDDAGNAELPKKLERTKEVGTGAAGSAHTTPRPAWRWNIVVPVSAALVVALGIGGWLFFSRKAHALSETDTIILADFKNTTGDSVFDDALKQALSISLRQSPFLNILSDEKVSSTLRLMTRPVDTRLTPDVAREVCQRVGSKAYIEGSIVSFGSQYVLGVDAMNCTTGDSLAAEQVRATGKEKVLDALGNAATKLRAKLGESLSSIRKLDKPLPDATTSSLEALKAFTLGVNTVVVKGDIPATVPMFQRALTLDPNFAMAYLMLGLAYAFLGEDSLAAENCSKAYELRDRASEPEKLQIEAQYYATVTGNLEKVRQVYEFSVQEYPQSAARRWALSAAYARIGQYEKAVAEGREAFRLDPATAAIIDYAGLATYYIALGRYEDARATVKEAQEKKLDSAPLRMTLYELAFLKDETGGMAEQVAWSEGRPGVEDVLLDFEADTAAYSGRLQRARQFSRRAVASAQRADEKETAAGYEAEAARREALFGNAIQARQRAAVALNLSIGRDVQCKAALALALAGDAVRAKALADDLAKRFTENTWVQYVYLPTIRAQLALSENDAAKSIEALQVAIPYELGQMTQDPIQVRAQGYLTLRHGAPAAGEFRKILDHAGIVGNDPIGALARLGLARAYAMQDDTRKARAAYQDFLTLWKDADPDIPILKQAKAEYAKLK